MCGLWSSDPLFMFSAYLTLDHLSVAAVVNLGLVRSCNISKLACLQLLHGLVSHKTHNPEIIQQNSYGRMLILVL